MHGTRDHASIRVCKHHCVFGLLPLPEHIYHPPWESPPQLAPIDLWYSQQVAYLASRPVFSVMGAVPEVPGAYEDVRRHPRAKPVHIGERRGW